MTVPGVNLICAATFLAAVGDIRRFSDQPQAGRLPRAGPEGPPVRRRAARARADLQARLRARALGAGRGGLERGPAARPAARVLRAHPRPPRPRQGDRRDRPQARDPVLVPAHPRRGLRPPAAVADQQEAPPARDHRRRAEAPTAAPPGSGAPTEPMRDAERELAHQAEASYKRMVRDRQAAGTSKKSGRERDTGARINQALEGQSRAADSQAPDVCASLRQSPAPDQNLTLPHDADKPAATSRAQIATTNPPTWSMPTGSSPQEAICRPPNPPSDQPVARIHPKVGRQALDFHRSAQTGDAEAERKMPAPTTERVC